MALGDTCHGKYSERSRKVRDFANQERGKGGLNTSLRSKQRQFETSGAVCHPAREFRGKGDHSTLAQEVLPEHCLIFELGLES